jgi:hypothetical protein
MDQERKEVRDEKDLSGHSGCYAASIYGFLCSKIHDSAGAYAATD